MLDLDLTSFKSSVFLKNLEFDIFIDFQPCEERLSGIIQSNRYGKSSLSVQNRLKNLDMINIPIPYPTL